MPDNLAQIPGLLQQAVTHHRAGRMAEAERLYRRVLQVAPDNGDALRLLAGIELQSGRHSLAETHLRRALAARPDHAELHWMLGTALMERGRDAAAAQSARRALELDADFAPARLLLGNALHAAGDVEGAEQAWRAVLARDPKNAPTQFNLAQLLLKSGRNAEAKTLLEDAVAAQPNHGGALGLLGQSLVIEDDKRAIGLLRRAMTLGNRSAAIHVALGRALFREKDRFGARSMFEEAIKLDAKDAAAYVGLGEVSEVFDQPDRAVELYRRALVCEPDNHDLRLKVSTALDGLWRTAEGFEFCRQQAATSSFFASTLCYHANLDARLGPAQVFEQHREWARRYADPLLDQPPAFANPPDPARRLRLGYVSGDLRRHSVAIFLHPLLQAQDRRAFEIFVYNNNQEADDAVTERLRPLADTWRNIQTLDDTQARALIRSDGIDILVDLSGHTAMHRLEMFARRPAPVQITYLGAIETTGMLAMDYRIVDPETDPPGLTERYHTEKLLRMEGGFLCYEPLAVAVEPAPPALLRKGYVTFGSTNNLAKISGAVIALWARVLHAVPDARLLMRDYRLATGAVRSAVRQRFAEHGIAADRLQLHGRIKDDAEHLQAYNEIDILLDPFPYNGVTTTCESLWMGVPVIALEGQRSGARTGLAILTHAGVPDLAAPDPDAYVAIAAGLAGDTERLAALHRELRPRMLASPLCDASRLAREIERGYRHAWRDWCHRQAG